MKTNYLLRVLLLMTTISPAAVALGANIEVDGIYYDYSTDNKTASVTENPAGYSGDIVIPETIQIDGDTYVVTSIGSSAFNGCIALTTIDIPASVTEIEYSAFAGCSSLTYIDIPTSLTSIGDYAFFACGLEAVNISDLSAWCKIDFFNSTSNPLYYAHNLYLNGDLVTHLTIPADITKIKNSAFSGCSSLTSIDLPDGLTEIENYAFEYCSGLTSIELPNGLTTIRSGTFGGCTGLTSINIPAGVTSIGSSAFLGCSSLTSIDLPAGVTTIGSSAFENCSSLTSVDLSDSLTEIGHHAFSGCDGLSEIVSKNPVPPVASESSFDDRHYMHCILKVPQNAVDDYRNADVWCNFAVIVGEFGGVGDVDNNTVTVTINGGDIVVGGLKPGEEVKVYNLAGQLIHSGTETTICSLPDGLYIVRAAGQIFKVAL